MKHLIFFVLTFSSFVTFGQLLNIPAIGNEVMRESRYSDIEGSPYWNTDWRSGNIFDQAGKEYPNKLIKYDEFKDQLELNQDGQVLLLNTALYPKFKISIFNGETTTQTIHLFQTGFKVAGYKESQYFEVLFQGAYIFLKKSKVSFIDETVNSYGTSTRIKKFTKDMKYFLVNSQGLSFEFKLKKKSLLDILGVDGMKAEKYINENKVKINTEDDIIEVLKNI